MRKVNKILFASLGAVTLGLSGCSVFAKTIQDPGDTQESEGQLKVLKADYDCEQLSRIDSIKAEYLLENKGYSENDTVSVILELEQNPLIDRYLNAAGDAYESVGDYAVTAEGMLSTKVIEKEQEKLVGKLINAGLIDSVDYRYKTILNGIACTTTYGDFLKLEDYVGVKNAVLQDRYNPAETTSTETGGAVQNLVDVYETGIFNSSTVDYTGNGTAVAILDSGFDCSHEVFANQPEKGLIDQQYVASVLDESNAKKTTPDLKLSDVYYSKKIPFVYDYADKDADVTPYDSEHGTHVAGIIGGKSSTITGVAVNTQLVLMKVFPNLSSGADTDDILAALEDAVLLKVDAINMSLGSSCGFSREEDGNLINTVYDKINQSGISLLTAASNSYSSSYGSEQGNTNKVTNPDSATVGSPSTYEAALSVASISGTKSKYLIGNGEQVIFFNESNNLASKPYDFFEMLNLPESGDKVYEYVTVPGVGMLINYSGLNVKGKIALVRRGDNTFEEKAKIAASQGAAGIIIYNNVAGDILMSMGKDLSIPCISISKDDGTELAKKSTGTLTLNRENLAGPFMSDFSSWGPTPDLKIKPEITAHGGNIKSAIPGGGYDELSGTSMATPNLCGIVILIRQYVKETFPELSAKEVSVRVNQLLMSTATIALNEEGIPYSPRKQGAGLANLFNAVNTNAYITVDGIDRSKLELGDDPKKTGTYTMNFNVVNTSDHALSYAFDLTGMTETVSSSDSDFVAESDQILQGKSTIEVLSGGSKTGDGEKTIVTVDASSACKLSVTYVLSDEDKTMLNNLFPYGMFVEGFAKLEAVDESEIDLSVPFLAFYGDWTVAPIFDKTYYEVESEAHDSSIDDEDKIKADVLATTPYASYYNNYIVPMGTYLYDLDEEAYDPIPASEEHAGVSTLFGSADGIASIYAGLLRGAKTMNFTITDKVTGEVVYEHLAYNANKSYSLGGSPYPYYEDIQCKSSQLGLINNRQYEFKMYGLLDYKDGGATTNVRNTFSFTFTCDDQAPMITNASFEKKYDKTLKKDRYYIYLTVYDNHYVQAITPILFTSSSSYTTLTENPIPVYGEKNSYTEVKFEITDYIDALYDDKVITSSLAFIVDDYALNSNLYLVQLPGTDGDFKFTENGQYDGTPVNAISAYVGETIDLTDYLASNDPNLDADKDYLKYLDWTSSNEKIAVVKEGQLSALSKGRVQVTVGEVLDGRKTSVIINVKDKPVSLAKNKKAAVNNDEVSLEELKFTYFTTTYAFLSAGDTSEIGDTGTTHYFTETPKINFYPGERIRIHYSITPWYLPESRYELVWESSNPEVATVDQNGNVEAMKKGNANISLRILVDGKMSNIMASTRVTVKSEFVIEDRTLVAYKGRGGDVVIPDDEGIFYIGSFAFCLYDLNNDIIIDEDDYDANKVPASNLSVTSVVVPEGVEEIQKYAFYNCEALQSVTLPESIKYVREYAFYNDQKLETVNLEKVIVIGANAFYNCVLLDGVDLSSIYAIGVRAFDHCSSLSSVDLSTLRNTGKEAFRNCTSLETLTLSEDTKLSYGMFVNSGIRSLTLGVDRIPDFAFANCAQLVDLTINGDVIDIGEGAFSGDTALKNVTFNGTLEEMGDQAFYKCTSLETITLPNSSVRYGSYVFYDCTNLKSVAFGENSYIETLGGSFLDNTGVRSFVVGNSNFYLSTEDSPYLVSKDGSELILAAPDYPYETVTLEYASIGAGAFSGIKTLTGVIFTDPNTVIGDYAFTNCANLAALTLPEGGITIGKHAFQYAENLTSVVHLDRVAAIGDYAFANTGLTEVVLGDNVVVNEGGFFSSKVVRLTLGANANIGFGAFQKCTELETVVMPEHGGVTVGTSAFAGDTKLSEIDLTKLGESIGNEAFYNCSSLTKADLASVKFIGDYAFADCSRLKEISLSSVVLIGEGAFARVSETGGAPIFTALVLPDTLEGIGMGAFLGCGGFTEVTLPEGFETIEDFTFSYCTGLLSVHLPDSLTSIGEYAFIGCSALVSVDGGKIASFGDYAFASTTALLNCDLSSAVRVGNYAFLNSGLKNTGSTAGIETIGEYAFQANYFTEFDASGAVEIGEGAFNSNQQLTKFVLSEKIASFGDLALLGCSSLTKITDPTGSDTVFLNDYARLEKGVLYTSLPNGLLQLEAYPGGNPNSEFSVLEGTVRIERYAGNMNAHLVKLILPDSLKSIGNFAFNGCTSLKTVEFRSFTAPVLESTYGMTNLSDPTLSETDPGYDLLHGYFDMFGVEAYYAQFIDLVGKNRPIQMILPANEGIKGYDTIIFEAYFGKVGESARSTYVARDENTVLFLDYYRLIPDLDQVTVNDASNIDSALTAYNALKQDLTAYGYTESEILAMKEKLDAAKSVVQEIRLSTATQKIKDIQAEINALPETFSLSDLALLKDLTDRINALKIEEKQILDLSAYNALTDAYNAYLNALESDIEQADSLSSGAYDYAALAIAGSLALASAAAGWVFKKKFF